MIREVLQSIEGIGIYPTISLLLFIAVFVIMVIKTVKLDKDYLDKMKRIPLEPEESVKDDRVGENG